MGTRAEMPFYDEDDLNNYLNYLYVSGGFITYYLQPRGTQHLQAFVLTLTAIRSPQFGVASLLL